MLTIKNISNNPLSMDDGKRLVPGGSRTVKSLGDRERKFQERGWLSVIEDPKPETTKAEGGKTEGGTSK